MAYLHINTNAELIAIANGDEFLEETVWRGDDGSFIIGADFPKDEVTCEYVEAGTLEEYATK